MYIQKIDDLSYRWVGFSIPRNSPIPQHRLRVKPDNLSVLPLDFGRTGYWLYTSICTPLLIKWQLEFNGFTDVQIIE